MSLISIILPVYHQADHIAAIVSEYESLLSRGNFAYELLLVVNGSRDDSLAVCQRIADEMPTVRVVASEPSGWGRAVRLGIEQARGDTLCYTNSARTSAQDLLLFALYAQVNPDTVIKANRRIRESRRRRFGSLLYNLECRALFDLPYWDINGTPKVFPRKFGKLLQMRCNDDLVDAEFNVICRRENYPMLEVPIFSTRRHGGKSTTDYRSALRLYWGVYQLWRAMRSETYGTRS